MASLARLRPQGRQASMPQPPQAPLSPAPRVRGARSGCAAPTRRGVGQRGARWICALALTVTLAALPTPTSAIPLRVLARSRLQLAATGNTQRVVVRARLIDDLGLGLAGRSVRLTLGERSVERDTGPDGALPAWRVEDLAPGRVQVRAEFRGDRLGHQGCRAERELEVSRPRPRLALEVADRVRGARPLRVGVRVTAGGRPVPGVVVALSADRRSVGGARSTSSDGRAAWTLRPEQIGGPGRHALTVRSEATERLGPGAVAGHVLRELPTSLSVGLALEEGLLEDRLVARGRLLAGGEPVGRRPLRIRLGTEGPWAAAGTDPDGRWAASWERSRLEPGLHLLYARYLGEPGLDPAEAQAEALVPALPPRSDLPQAAVALATALVLAGLAVAWWARQRSQPLASESGPEDPWCSPQPQRPAAPAWSTMDRDALQGTDAEAPDRLAGQLWDRVARRPIAGGRMRLTVGAGADGPLVAEATSDTRGMFVLQLPGAGTYTLAARAPGYVREQRRLPVPSRWTAGLRVGLMPVREMVRRTWVAAAERRLPPGGPVWGWHTPAQVLAQSTAAAPGGDGAELGALTRLSEEVIWGPGPHVERYYWAAQRLSGGAIDALEERGDG